MSQSEETLLSQVKNLYNFSKKSEELMPQTISPDPTITRELARKSLAEFEKLLEEAKIKAKETGKKMVIDGSRLSGIKEGGDKWTVHPDGTITRAFQEIPEIRDIIEMRRTERVADPDKPVDLETVYEIIRLAHRSPNATNEQPSRVLVYPQNHPSMDKIGIAMNDALSKEIVPDITLKNYLTFRKKEIPDFLPDYSLEQLEQMSDEEIKQFETLPAPLDELPRTANSLISRGKVLEENGSFYTCREKDGQVVKQGEYCLKDIVRGDKVFAQGMGRFFLKFKNTHPVLMVILRKVRYTSVMTESLEKYGIKLPDVGEAYIDSGIFTDHLALATRGFGLSGVIKTGPLDLAVDKIAEILIDDLTQQADHLKSLISTTSDDKELLEAEYQKSIHLRDGLKIGLEAFNDKMAHRKSSPEVRKQIGMGNGYFPSTFFQLGHPLADPSERVMDPRQGRNPLNNMTVYMNP